MKKILALILAMLMIVGVLASCGGGNENNNDLPDDDKEQNEENEQDGNGDSEDNKNNEANNGNGENSDNNQNSGNSNDNQNSGNSSNNENKEDEKPAYVPKVESTAGLEFKLNADGKSYTVTGIGTCTASEIVIDGHNGLPVTSIDNAALYGCTGLTSVIIPDSVTSIGGFAFSGCSGLTSITIPNSVTSIGGSAFKNCTNLKVNEYNNGIYLGNNTNPYVVLCNVDDTVTTFSIPDATKIIYHRAFEDCTNITSVTIPNSVTNIGDYAFSGCTGLTSVEFKNTEGWKADDTSISSTDLEDKAKAADYLTNIYNHRDWTRS